MILNAISATRTPEDQKLPFVGRPLDLADPGRARTDASGSST